MWGSWYLLGSRDGRVITSFNAGMPRNIPYLCFGDARLALGIETDVVAALSKGVRTSWPTNGIFATALAASVMF